MGIHYVRRGANATARGVTGEVPLLLTTLGYASDQPGIKERKQMEEIVRYVR